MSKEKELLKNILATGLLNNTIYCREVEKLLAQPAVGAPHPESLRDHFAGLAMQGLLVSMKFESSDLCVTAYAFADVMMAAREKGNDH